MNFFQKDHGNVCGKIRKKVKKTTITNMVLYQIDDALIYYYLFVNSIDLSTIPLHSGVYQMLDERGDILYIGKAKNLKKRVSSYAKTEKLSLRLKRMVALIRSVDVIITKNEAEALILESNLIKQHRPPYNILLKDDKSYPFILLTQNHPFPRILKHRGKQTVKGHYFGPFASAEAVYETIVQLQKIFRLRGCSDSYFSARKKPCLQYHLKRCSAPCVKYIDEKDYSEMVDQSLAFLKGKNDSVQSYLATKMQKASDRLEFEQAAMYRDQLQIVSKLQKQKTAYVANLEEADVIGFFREHKKICIQIFMFRFGRNLGNIPFILDFLDDENLEAFLQSFLMQFYQDKIVPSLIILDTFPLDKKIMENILGTKFQCSQKALLEQATQNAKEHLSQYFLKNMSMKRIFEDMKNVFSLPNIPSRIEVYDNTHNQGENAYSVMIVANQEGFDKKQYRKFLMDTNDDYAMMRSVMKRRFQHTEWDRPDFMIIDGGLGQLHAVQEALQELSLSIPCVAMSKGSERKVGEEKYIINEEQQVTPSVTLSYFLQRLRDEAHRFAIGAHRQKSVKKLKKSALDDIPGIGPRRKKALLQHFGSVDFIKKAALEDLQSIPGIDQSVAKRIYDFFHLH